MLLSLRRFWSVLGPRAARVALRHRGAAAGRRGRGGGCEDPKEALLFMVDPSVLGVHEAGPGQLGLGMVQGR